eukprot:SAG31_NODE_1114_length_9852_cov_2.761509_10_plen_51_part_00
MPYLLNLVGMAVLERTAVGVEDKCTQLQHPVIVSTNLCHLCLQSLHTQSV